MKRLILSKRGESGDWGVEEVAKTVVAIIGITIIALLLASLFGIFSNKKEISAERDLEQLYEQSSLLKEGESGFSLLQGPEEWILLHFDPENFYYSKPAVCVGKNCLCLCPYEADKKKAAWRDVTKDCLEDGGACKDFGVSLEADFVAVMGSVDMCERTTPGVIDETFNRCLKAMRVNEFLSLQQIPQLISFRKEGGKIHLAELEQGFEATSNFLDKDIGGVKMEDFLADKIFKNCESWNPSLEDSDEESLKTSTEEYLASLIKEGKIKGGVVVFTSQKDNVHHGWSGRISNLLLVKQGETGSCSVLEERIVCKKSMEADNSKYNLQVRGYVRIYTCS